MIEDGLKGDFFNSIFYLNKKKNREFVSEPLETIKVGRGAMMRFYHNIAMVHGTPEFSR